MAAPPQPQPGPPAAPAPPPLSAAPGPGQGAGPGPPLPAQVAAAQAQDFDPVQRFRLLIPQLKESLQTLMKVAAQNLVQNSNIDNGQKSADGALQRFDKSLEEFYALCDQLELCLPRVPPGDTPFRSAWRTSASRRASTVQSTHLRWCQRPPRARGLPVRASPTPSTCPSSRHRSQAPRTSTMPCWRVPTRSPASCPPRGGPDEAVGVGSGQSPSLSPGSPVTIKAPTLTAASLRIPGGCL
uniref:Mediator of RNA polymerase II transcription subunit 29 n=1 Tax=Gallus gallus TaxID=9031 RepID=A0A8V0Y004_CHICK